MAQPNDFVTVTSEAIDESPPGLLVTTMHIRQRDEQSLSPDVLSKLRAQAQDPSIFDEEQPYVFDLVASAKVPDTYGTIMQESSLRNYSADGAAGVSLLYGHDRRSVPHGRTFDGTYKDARTKGGPLSVVTAYMARGVVINDRSNDDMIRLVRMGQLADTSISFYNERITCSLDGKPMLDMWDMIFGGGSQEACQHVPGMEYDWQGSRQIAYGLVDDAHMSEVSLVFDGSTPGAAVVKGRRMADAGILPYDIGVALEQRYHVRMPGMHRVWAPLTTQEGTMAKRDNDATATAESTEATTAAPVEQDAQQTPVVTESETPVVVEERSEGDDSTAATTETPQEVTENESDTAAAPAAESSTTSEPPAAEATETTATASRAHTADARSAGRTPPSEEDEMQRTRQALVTAGIVPKDFTGDPYERITQLGTELPDLRSRADDGSKYRNAMIDEALKEGRRANGAGFSEERYKSMLSRSATTLEEIIGFRDDWRSQGDELFKNGRRTTDGPGDRNGNVRQTENGETVVAIRPPADAYTG